MEREPESSFAEQEKKDRQYKATQRVATAAKRLTLGKGQKKVFFIIITPKNFYFSTWFNPDDDTFCAKNSCLHYNSKQGIFKKTEESQDLTLRRKLDDGKTNGPPRE